MTCPEGTALTGCGGPGIPCCCGAPGPVTYTCASAPDCDGTPACECLPDTCNALEFCRDASREGEVVCEPNDE